MRILKIQIIGTKNRYLSMFLRWTIIILSIQTIWANDTYQQALDIRARGYAAYEIARDLADNVNQVDMLTFRENVNPSSIPGARASDIPFGWNEVLKDYMESTNNRARVLDQNLSGDALVDGQTKLDKEFFTRKGLAPVQSLSELSTSELFLLRNHSSKPLDMQDPSKALEIINKERKKIRDYVSKVKDFSNEMVSKIARRAPAQYTNRVQRQIYERARDTKYGKRYIEMVQLRLGGVSGDIQALTVVDPNNRLKLLDIITGGSANPAKNVGNSMALKSAAKNIDIAEAIKKLPKDMATREAFARYILENGSENQLRSLKINDPSTMFHMQKKAEFKAKLCR